MSSEIKLMDEFSIIFYNALADIQGVIPELDEQYNKQQVLSLKRRLVFLKDEAGKAGIDLLVRLIDIFVDFLDESEDNYSCLTATIGVILDSFRLALEIFRMELDGKDIPENYAEMILDSFIAVLARCSQKKCDCDDDKVRSWVLIADDEDAVRTYVEDVLFSSGYLVLSAQNGRQAISAISTGIFNIIFTDINMPYKSGYDILYYVQEYSIEADVIVFTGFSSAKSVSKAIHGGAYDYIGKPFNGPEDIVNAAERAMQHRRLENRNKLLMESLHENNVKLQQYAEGLEEALRSLEEKNQALVRAERMATIGVLVAGLAHEINNPNTFIRGNIQTLQKFWEFISGKLETCKADSEDERLKYISSEMPSLLDGMFAGTERVANITRGLKAFARVDDVTEKMEACDARDLIEAALVILENKIKDNNVIIEQHIEQTPKLFVAKQQVVEAFVNIIQNSIEAVANLKIRLINIRVFAGSGGVTIEIVDNGCGIKENIQDKIFDPFFTTKPVDKGTGLGLSIAEGVILAQGGRVSLVKSDSEGSTFEIYIPSSYCIVNSVIPTVLMFASQTPAFRAFEAGILAAGNYNLIEGLGNFSDLSARLDDVKPDLVILDVKWSDASGSELADNIKKIVDKNIKVICVVDGRFDKRREKDFYNLGVDKIIVLPASLGHLLDLLGALLEE